MKRTILLVAMVQTTSVYCYLGEFIIAPLKNVGESLFSSNTVSNFKPDPFDIRNFGFSSQSSDDFLDVGNISFRRNAAIRKMLLSNEKSDWDPLPYESLSTSSEPMTESPNDVTTNVNYAKKGSDELIGKVHHLQPARSQIIEQVTPTASAPSKPNSSDSWDAWTNSYDNKWNESLTKSPTFNASKPGERESNTKKVPAPNYKYMFDAIRCTTPEAWESKLPRFFRKIVIVISSKGKIELKIMGSNDLKGIFGSYMAEIGQIVLKHFQNREKISPIKYFQIGA